MTLERRKFINTVVQYAYTLDNPAGYCKLGLTPPLKNCFKASVYERTAMLEYAKLLQIFEEVDPKDLLTDYVSHFKDEMNRERSSDAFLWGYSGLMRLAYYLGFEND